MSFASDVRRGLSRRPRSLPPRWFYDTLGSRLFDAICALPWYRITRAELGLLPRAARAARRLLGRPGLIVEMGCGNGEKLEVLLEGIHDGKKPLVVGLVDLSSVALAQSRRRVARFSGLSFFEARAPFEAGLARALRVRPRRQRALVVFLGSNIGNFDPPVAARFLRAVRRALRPGDAFLLGADLVKPEADLLLAYDDPLGVTAAFNRNVLMRMNRELGANFDPGAFRHRAVWNATARRVEMHLVSRRAQVVRIPAVRMTVLFRRGESIFTEASYKYTAKTLAAEVASVGFAVRRQWIDRKALFALMLLEAV